MIKDSFETILKKLPYYEPRPLQVKMAEIIQKSLKERKHVLIEAGTGSGKSLAYLYPVVSNNATAVISTGTIALQEQLLYKDIPFLMSVTEPFKAVIAKGRGNYLCRQKLWEVERELLKTNPLRNNFNAMVKEMGQGWDGDFGNLSFELPYSLKGDLAGDSEDCYGDRCEFYDNICFWRKARAELKNADIIITNHSLYFTDIATGEGILPKHEFVVFDEAHHIEDTAIRAFTIEIGRYAILRLLQKIKKRIAHPPSEIADRLTELEIDLFEWLSKHNENKFSCRLKPDNDFHFIVKDIISSLDDLRQWLTNVNMKKLTFDEDSFKKKAVIIRDKIEERLKSLIRRWKFFLSTDGISEDELSRVNWIEINDDRAYYTLKSAPLFVTDVLEEKLWPRKTVVCTSATLSVENNFDYLKKRIGVDNADTKIFASPFNFKQQAALYIPTDIPEPNSKEYIRSCIPLIRDVLDLSQGRAFLLFSSYYVMNTMFNSMSDEIDFPLKKQGDMPRKLLIDWFKETPNAVLFATSTFREGVDIRGDALSCIIIDRIPFSVPDDPVVEARVEYMKNNNMDWFKDYMLPEAIIRLKQGVGRLIRTKDDKGIVVILDSRLNTKYYGKKVLNSLPDITRIKKLEESQGFIN